MAEDQSTENVPSKPAARPDRCETCRFWVRYKAATAADDIGSCHRYPPPAKHTAFPTTYPQAWCGEWREKAVSP